MIEDGTSSSWDGIGLLLCAHIVLRLQMVTHKRAVPALDQFFSAALDCIWPALDRSLTANAYSLRNCETMPTDLMPHYVHFHEYTILNIRVISKGLNAINVNYFKLIDNSSIC